MSGRQLVPTLYQEVCLSLDPASPSSIININANTSSSLFSTSRKRTFDEISGLDEERYSRKHLASESSLFFRKREYQPRSILWRVLDNRQLLELQTVELLHKGHNDRTEGCLTFHVALPTAIIPGGVALADSQPNDALEVFALTTGNELFTITLKRDLLARDAPPKDFDTSTCIQKHSLASLSFRRPYKLAVVNATQLLVSLHDGGILRLERDSTSHSAIWKETFYSEGGWTGTLRGLIPLKRHQTVRYGDIELEPSAAVALAESPDGQHIWTVSLDHELTAWSTQTGKVVARRDLMGARHDPDMKRTSQYVMPAEQGNLLKIITPDAVEDADQMSISSTSYQIIVYSPKERAFKIFLAQSTSSHDSVPRITDVLQGEKLSLPFDDILNTNLWRCADFQCKMSSDWQMNLWVRIQSGAASTIFTSITNLMQDGEIAEDWQRSWLDSWTVIHSASTADVAIPTLDTSNTTSVAKRWLTYVLYPGRYSLSALESALHVYQQRRKLPTLNKSRQSLEERLCTSTSAKLPLPNKNDFEAWYKDLHIQWTAYHSILNELQSKRLEIKNFAYDADDDLAWIVHADFVAPVRAHDKLERLLRNAKLDTDEDFDQVGTTRQSVVKNDDEWDSMKLISAAQSFATSLTPAFRQSFAESAIAIAMLNDDDSDAQLFFDQMDVGQHVTDEAYQNLELALQPLNGIGGLVNHTFQSLVQDLEETGPRGAKSNYTLNRYGSRFMVATAQDYIRHNKQLLLDLLALVAFINNDFEADALDDAFNPYQLFHIITSKLRSTELRDWLTRNICLESSHTLTIFESLFIGDWDSHAPKALTLTEKLTHWSRQWAFAAFDDWHGFTANIYSTLLRSKMYDLAVDFTQFLQQNDWTTYLQGRLQLALGEYDEATTRFEAAKGLSDTIKGDFDTASLLSAEELNHFGRGPEYYYLHIANMFEKIHLYATTADFAEKALSYIDVAQVEREILRTDVQKKSTKSSVETIANARAEVKLLKVKTVWEELVSRLFNALVQTGRMQDAYMALQKFGSPELRKSSLQMLVDYCVKNDILEIVLELPFDNDTAELADAALLKMAKKNLSSGTTMHPAQKVLYAFRTSRGDYRGASQVLYEHLEIIKHQKRRQNPDDDTLPHAYLMLINTLACCGEGEEWLLADPIEAIHPADRRRKLVTLEDVRREYVAELDRRSDLQHGRFPLIGDDDEMDVL